MDYDNAKRFKSSSGSPVSVKRSAATALPQYQPPPARGSLSQQTPSASLSRTPPPGGKNSLKLTVKAAPSKLRQAISGSQLPPNPYTDEASESDATPKPSARAARATRNPRTVVEQDSDEDDEDEDDEEDAEGEDDEEDAEGEDVDDELLANEDSQDDDAEGEDDDIEDSHPPPPILKQQKVPGKPKVNVTVSAPAAGPLKSVEAKELEDADDDEELSDLESADEMDLGDGEEDVDIGGDDDDLSGSDIDGSRSATPDPSKLTRRQRGVLEEEEIGLLALSNEAQKKKLLSVEEHAMRRQEMARRRKNLSEKRNEEEKMETINKLLSKPAPKRRTRAEMIAAQQAADMTPGAEGEEGGPRANPLFSRWVNNEHGSRVAVPDEWLESPIGAVFKGATTPSNGKMVQEVA